MRVAMNDAMNRDLSLATSSRICSADWRCGPSATPKSCINDPNQDFSIRSLGAAPSDLS